MKTSHCLLPRLYLVPQIYASSVLVTPPALPARCRAGSSRTWCCSVSAGRTSVCVCVCVSAETSSLEQSCWCVETRWANVRQQTKLQPPTSRRAVLVLTLTHTHTQQPHTHTQQLILSLHSHSSRYCPDDVLPLILPDKQALTETLDWSLFLDHNRDYQQLYLAFLVILLIITVLSRAAQSKTNAHNTQKQKIKHR